MRNQFEDAIKFAVLAHKDQKRKYTNEPYIVHPVAVAKLVYPVTSDIDVLSAAVLHDVIEDTDIGYRPIRKAFGARTANLVAELTNTTPLSAGNRALRKELECQRLAGVSAEAQTIKLADLIDNASSIVTYDKEFAKTYMKEMSDLVKALTKANGYMQIRANLFLKDYYQGKIQ